VVNACQPVTFGAAVRAFVREAASFPAFILSRNEAMPMKLRDLQFQAEMRPFDAEVFLHGTSQFVAMGVVKWEDT
jgi:hypothetical protein